MNTSPKKPTFKIHMTLFWRLFLSLLFTILITSALSIVVERWLNKQELATRMDSQIDRLLIQRERLVTALQVGDMAAVKRVYEQDRRLMSQIRVYDEQGAIIFPRYRYQDGRHQGSGHQSMNMPAPEFAANPSFDNNGFGRRPFNDIEANDKLFALNDILQPMPFNKAMADADSRPELADVVVALPDAQSVIIQLRPHLLFKDVLELQRSNFAVRLILIIVFSVLVCFWLSRTMTKRIRRVQHSVHRLLVGDYQVNPKLQDLGSDELGLLGRDVAQLSKRLADSELARKQMLSDISHELRSPLARLEVATELTRDFAPNTSRYLDRIDKESARMNELIEQIIHIQSLQMQQYSLADLESEAVNLSEIISEIGQDVCFEFQHKQVQWLWQPPTSDYYVLGNAEQLHSALENVIRNAFMHTPAQSKVTAELASVQIAKAPPALQISITDEGGGVAEQDLQRIFQPFVRLDSARHRQTGGYGLGLAIVHAVVMAHKGQLTVSNRQDGIQGLVMQITLPIHNIRL
jgi:signal transduction histidine kinase